MKHKEKSHTFLKFLGIIIILATILYLYGRYVNTTGFIVKEKAIYDSKLNPDYNGFKIAHFSDIHYGRTTTEEDLKKLTKKINELNPHIVIFTGDLFDNKNISEDEKNLMIKYLKEIKASIFKFAIVGDYDEKYLSTFASILENSDFILLNNSSKKVYHNSNTPLNFIGLSNTDSVSELYNNELYNITIIHKPDLIENLNNTNIIFAGHSLGGQIKIPFMDGIRKIEGASKYLNEYYQVNKSQLYISNGIGTQDFSFRLFNKPSITLYRLYNS